MLDIKFIRENPDKVKQNIKNRGVDPKKADIDKLLLLDGRKTKLSQEIDKLREARNKLAEELKNTSKRTSENIDEGKKIKEAISILENELTKVDKEWQEVMDWIPNILADDVPIGKGEDDNLEIKAWTSKDGSFSKEKLGMKDFSRKWMPRHNFKGRDQMEINKLLDVIDIEQSGKTSGSRFYYLKDDLVLLQYAYFDLLFKKLIRDHKFHPIAVPLLVKERVLYGTSHFPEGRDQVYKIEKENVEEGQELYLVGSSEPSLFAYWMDRVIPEEILPYRMCATTSCFRSEVGSWGKDVKGIKRVHQFEKMEIDVVCTPDQSEEIFAELLSINEWFYQTLKLPYHQILKCSGDSGYAASYKQIDNEVWLPTTEEFIEVGTDTNARDFQARRLNIRVQLKDGTKVLAHTVNNTGITNTRPLIAIMDNYQNPDGSITIPEVLQDYMGKELISSKNS